MSSPNTAYWQATAAALRSTQASAVTCAAVAHAFRQLNPAFDVKAFLEACR